MKLLYVTQFYKPEAIASAFRAAEHAAHWAESGMDVTVFTGYPNYPGGVLFPGYRVENLSQERDGKVRLLRSRLSICPNTSFSKRVRSSMSFFFNGLWNLFFRADRVGRGFDAVLGTSGIVFAAVLAWIYAACHRIPFVFELRDLTWQQLMATGHAPKGLPVRLMRALELFLCRRAKAVVVVTEGFRETLISQGIPEAKLHVVTNGVDLPELSRTPAERFCLSYFGTLGVSQNIPGTFSAAKKLHSKCPDFEYLIIGEGAQRGNLEALLRAEALPFVRLLPGMEAERLEPYYAITGLSVVTLRKDPNFCHTLPSKLFQIMGRGIPVLFIGPEGEAARLVRRFDAGLTLTGSPEEDLQTLENFLSLPDWREKLRVMGENGRKAVAAHYTRAACADNMKTILESVVNEHAAIR